MQTGVPEKLLKIADDIAAAGKAELTRLTVLKKWFGHPGRLPAFALWTAGRAISRKGKTAGDATKLFRDAKALLKELDAFCPVVPPERREAIRGFYNRLQSFQNIYRDSRWGRIRMVDNWNLYLVEKSVAILLHPSPAPADGYKLAAGYCQNYNPRYGNGLNGPSATRIMEIRRWMFGVEAWEEENASRDN